MATATGHAHESDEAHFLDELAAFLITPATQQLLAVHPNHTTSAHFFRPASWSSWWTWASADDSPDRKWLQLWHYYVAPHSEAENFASIPPDVRRLIDECRRLQLSRDAGTAAAPPSASRCASTVGAGIPLPAITPSRGRPPHGMSPKKAHEVRCMAEYTSRLLAHLPGARIRHVVDVGAGQAYVTRALRDELGLDVLALDWSAVQTEGAARRDTGGARGSGDVQREGGTCGGSLTYRTLAINTESLLGVTDEWMCSAMEDGPDEHPVLLFALHACGSLTLDILRAFCKRVGVPGLSRWRPAAALIVGCCYNLLSSPDCTPLTGRAVTLSPNHLQLAAQVPRHWDRTPEAFAEARLAVKKVAWRALLEGIIERARAACADEDASIGRLGRLSDAAYKDWETFLSTAQRKLGLDLGGVELDRRLESCVEVLHVLRCMLGPVIESFLLLDRKVWLQGELQGSRCVVELVNLFDQRADSARNVAVVIAPEQL